MVIDTVFIVEWSITLDFSVSKAMLDNSVTVAHSCALLVKLLMAFDCLLLVALVTGVSITCIVLALFHVLVRSTVNIVFI